MARKKKLTLRPLPRKFRGQTNSQTALALLNGSEINYTELAKKLEIGRTTLWRYRSKDTLKPLIAFSIICVFGYIPPKLFV